MDGTRTTAAALIAMAIEVIVMTANGDGQLRFHQPCDALANIGCCVR